MKIKFREWILVTPKKNYFWDVTGIDISDEEIMLNIEEQFYKDDTNKA